MIRDVTTVGIRDLARRASAIVRNVRETGEPAIVTDRGRAVGVLYPIDADAFEDYVLANAPEARHEPARGRRGPRSRSHRLARRPARGGLDGLIESRQRRDRALEITAVDDSRHQETPLRGTPDIAKLGCVERPEQHPPVARTQPQPRRPAAERDEVDVRRQRVGGQVLPKRSDDATPVAVGEPAEVALSATAEPRRGSRRACHTPVTPRGWGLGPPIPWPSAVRARSRSPESAQCSAIVASSRASSFSIAGRCSGAARSRRSSRIARNRLTTWIDEPPHWRISVKERLDDVLPASRANDNPGRGYVGSLGRSGQRTGSEESQHVAEVIEHLHRRRRVVDGG